MSAGVYSRSSGTGAKCMLQTYPTSCARTRPLFRDDGKFKVLTSSSRILVEEQNDLAQRFHKKEKVAVG